MATPENVDGYSLNTILVSAEQLLGAKIYQTALQRSGLERFKAAPPPPTPEQIATAQELSDFWQAVYNQVAFPTFKLFQRNVGGNIATVFEAGPPMQALKAQILALPKAERLEVAVTQISQAVNENGVQTSFRSYEQGYLLYFNECPFICQSIQATEPICHVYEFMFFKLLQWLSQLPLLSSEVECRAMGQAQCLNCYRSYQ